MSSIKNIIEEMGSIRGLEQLTYVYADIASLRMKQTQNSVLSQRTFLEGLSSVFEDVRFAYAQYVKRRLGAKQLKEKITFLAHNGRSVGVFLSANAGLYGAIVPETFRLFMESIRKKNLEVVIVGLQGLSLFLSEEPDRPYTFFELPDYGPIEGFLKPLINHIVQYETVHVFYGKYKSVISQVPEEAVIASHTGFEEPSSKKHSQYYFEPSLEQVLIFFETEFFSSLVDQAINESRLAKYASRIISMDQASVNIKKRVKILQLEKLSQVHRTFNKKQLNILPAFAFRSGRKQYE